MSMKSADTLSESIRQARIVKQNDEKKRQEISKEREIKIVQDEEQKRKELLTGLKTGTFQLGDKYTYTGNLMNGLRDGPGVTIKQYDTIVESITTGTYVNGSREGVFVTTYRGGKRKISTYLNNKHINVTTLQYTNGDTAFIDNKIITFVAKDGTKYKGFKSYITCNMWNTIVKMWTSINQTDNICEAFGGFVIGCVSAVATIVACVATPFTYAIDMIKRSFARIR